jgi:BASS family bile acid:Na+ symporter
VNEILAVVGQLAGLVFVVGSMIAMGLSLTVPQIIEPLKNVRLVILALVANFVLVPLLAYVITLIMSLSEAQETGLILLATAAGAPFLPKLAQAAKGDLAFSVGLMVLLMVLTVLYLPIVLPLLLSGVEVNPLEVARSLVVVMLLPLAVGLFVKARYAETAGNLQATFGQASNVSLMLFMGIMLVLSFRNILDIIGTGGILAGILLIAGSFVIGYLLGGAGNTRSVMALGTAQRNISAAIVVAAQNFSDPNVLVMLMVLAVIGLIILLPLGGELGKRQAAKQQPITGIEVDRAAHRYVPGRDDR